MLMEQILLQESAMSLKDIISLVCTGLSAGSAVLSVVSAVFAYKVSKKMYEVSKKQTEFIIKTEKDKQIPYLFPLEDVITKSKWVRFRSDNVHLDNVVPCPQDDPNLAESERKKIEKFVRECQEKTKKVYFDYFDGNLVLVMNGNTNTDKNRAEIVIEHNNAEVILQNYGAIITRLHINYVEIHYPIDNDDNSSNIVKFKDVYGEDYTGIIAEKETIKIVLDEVYNMVDNASCRITQNEYDTLQECELFTTDAPAALKYREFIIGFSVYNQQNEEFRYKLIIENKGSRFQRKVELDQHMN